MIKYIVTSLVLVLCQSTMIFSQDKLTDMEVYVEPYMSLSYQAFFKDLVLNSDNDYIEYISGFDFEWGYRYQLLVLERIYEEPMMDAGDREFKLLKMISKTRVEPEYTFSMRMEKDMRLDGEDMPDAIQRMEGNYFSYTEEMTFFVPDDLLAKFEKKVMESDSFYAVFGFTEEVELILKEVK